MKCRFKLTEQGEVIFARYGNPVLAIRHVESVAAATLLQSAPSVEKRNTEMTKKYADMAAQLDEAAHNRFLDLLNTDGFAPWFSTVTRWTEIRPAADTAPSGESVVWAPSINFTFFSKKGLCNSDLKAKKHYLCK